MLMCAVRQKASCTQVSAGGWKDKESKIIPKEVYFLVAAVAPVQEYVFAYLPSPTVLIWSLVYNYRDHRTS